MYLYLRWKTQLEMEIPRKVPDTLHEVTPKPYKLCMLKYIFNASYNALFIS